MKYSGEWHFSEENTFHYGYLEYDRGTEIILEIFDDVLLGLSEHRPGHSGITILGRLENGDKITLRNCAILSSQPYLDHFRITRIEAQFLFLGGHLKTEVEFDSSVVSYSNLSSFVSYSSLVKDPLCTVNQSTKNFERLLKIPAFCKILIFPKDGSLLFEIISSIFKILSCSRLRNKIQNVRSFGFQF